MVEMRYDGTMAGVMVRMDSNGRLVIPVELRRELGVEGSAELHVRLVDGELRISTLRTAIARAQRAVRRYVPEGRSLVAELIDERRKAAEDE
jgi:antitoxin PrlF